MGTNTYMQYYINSNFIVEPQYINKMINIKINNMNL